MFSTFCILILLSFQPGSTEIGTKLEGYVKTKTGIFIESLIKKRLSHCALFFYRDGFESARNGDLLSEIVMATDSIYYNVYHDYPLPEVHSLNENLNTSSGLQAPVEFGESVGNCNRKADRCKLVVIMVNDMRPEIFKQIYKTITPVYYPITKKDSDFYIFLTNEDWMEDLLFIYELPARTKYKIAMAENDRKLVVKSVCFFCNLGQPMIVQYPEDFSQDFNYFPDYVLNLNGRTLRITFPNGLAKIQVPKPWNGINNAERGMWKNFFEDFLMIKFNFTYNMFLSSGKDGKKGSSGGTGFELQNGTWTGTVGDVSAGRAEIAIFTAQSPRRIRQITFTNSFIDVTRLIFVMTDGERIFSPMALLWPFDLLMWGCIGLSTIVAFLVFGFLTKLMIFIGMDSPEMKAFARRGQISKEAWTFDLQIFFMGASYLDQDAVLPRQSGLRCFVAFWLFFCMIINTLYRAKMTSLLAFPVLEQLPKTFNELVNSDYSVGFIKHGDSSYNALKASKDPVYVKLLKEMEIIKLPGLDGLERVLNRRYATIGYDFAFNYLKAHNLSDSENRQLIVAPETTYNIFLGLGLEGGSIYMEGFDKWVSWTRPFHLPFLWETSDNLLIRKEKREWWKRTNQTDKLKKDDGEDNSDLTLKHTSGAFYLLGILLLVCLLVFLQELWYFYKDSWCMRLNLQWP